MATCGPSRASILTSRHPSTTRIFDTYSCEIDSHLNPVAANPQQAYNPCLLPRASPDWRNTSGNFTTIPQYFKNRGYLTAGIGKIFHPRFASGEIPKDPLSCPVCRGAHDADYSWTEPYFYDESGPYEYADIRATSWVAVPPDKGPLVDENVRDHAIEMLSNISSRRAAGEDRPFFVAVGFHKPHLPWVFPERFLSYYPMDEINLPSNPNAPIDMPLIAWSGYAELRTYRDVQMITAGHLPRPDSHLLPDIKIRELRRAYYAAMSYADDNVGQLLSALNDGQLNGARNLRDSTIVCAWSDHGWSLGEHGLWDKHTNFFTNTQAPLMFRVPGLTDGGIFTDQIASTADVFPTLVDLVFANEMPRCSSDELPADMNSTVLCTEGNSLVPLILDPNTPVKVAAYSMFHRPIPVTPALVSSPYATGFTPAVSRHWFHAHPNVSFAHEISLEADLPSLSSCIDGRGCVMGFSMLTRLEGCEVRYTEWVRYEGKSANWAPTWDTVYGRELYNHSCHCSPTDYRRHVLSDSIGKNLRPMFFVDHLENYNAFSRISAADADELHWRLHRGWELNFDLDSLSAVERRAYDAGSGEFT